MSDEDFRFNVLNHELVPLHAVMPDEEAQDALGAIGVTKEQLPKIRANDPAVRVVGGKPGQVVRVIRNSPTAGKAVVYRLVVEAI